MSAPESQVCTCDTWDDRDMAHAPDCDTYVIPPVGQPAENDTCTCAVPLAVAAAPAPCPLHGWCVIPPAVPVEPDAGDVAWECPTLVIGPNTDGEPCDWCQTCGEHVRNHMQVASLLAAVRREAERKALTDLRLVVGMSGHRFYERNDHAAALALIDESIASVDRIGGDQ